MILNKKVIMNKLRYYYCIYLFLSIFVLKSSNQVVVLPFVDFKKITSEEYALLLASTDVSASEASTQLTIGMSTTAYLAFSGRMDLFWVAAAKGYPIYPQEMINICAISNRDCTPFIVSPNAALNSCNQNALDIAVLTGNPRTVKQVISIGGTPNYRQMLTAIERNYCKVFRVLLKNTIISYDLLVTLVSLRNEKALKVLFQGRSCFKDDLENICWSHKWFPDCIFNND